MSEHTPRNRPQHDSDGKLHHEPLILPRTGTASEQGTGRTMGQLKQVRCGGLFICWPNGESYCKDLMARLEYPKDWCIIRDVTRVIGPAFLTLRGKQWPSISWDHSINMNHPDVIQAAAELSYMIRPDLFPNFPTPSESYAAKEARIGLLVYQGHLSEAEGAAVMACTTECTITRKIISVSMHGDHVIAVDSEGQAWVRSVAWDSPWMKLPNLPLR